MGVMSASIEDVSARQLWKAMMFGIDGADRFLPVTSVSVRAAHGAAAEEGAVWRSMKYEGPGPLQGQTIFEHCYADRETGEIRFVGLEGPRRQREGATEYVHALHTDPLRIEYYRRERLTRRRVAWAAPKEEALRPIEATIALARAADMHAADSSQFGGKA